MRCLSIPPALPRAVVLVCIFFFSACTNSADKALFDSLDQTISQSTEQLQRELQQKISFLQDELQYPCSRDRARQWLPVAKKAGQLTQEVLNYLSRARQPADKDGADSRDLFDSASARLKVYRDDILALHEQIRAEFTKSFQGIDTTAASQSTLSQHLRMVEKANDRQLAVIMAQLRYSVMQVGANVVAFCREHVGCITDSFETYAAIIGQSSTGILPGQNIEIFAGMGAFSKSAQPTITIDGKRCAVEDDGLGKLTIAASGKPGRYQTTVKIEYINQDGIKSRIDKVVEWEVIKR